MNKLTILLLCTTLCTALQAAECEPNKDQVRSLIMAVSGSRETRKEYTCQIKDISGQLSQPENSEKVTFNGKKYHKESILLFPDTKQGLSSLTAVAAFLDEKAYNGLDRKIVEDILKTFGSENFTLAGTQLSVTFPEDIVIQTGSKFLETHNSPCYHEQKCKAMLQQAVVVSRPEPFGVFAMLDPVTMQAFVDLLRAPKQ